MMLVLGDNFDQKQQVEYNFKTNVANILYLLF